MASKQAEHSIEQMFNASSHCSVEDLGKKKALPTF